LSRDQRNRQRRPRRLPDSFRCRHCRLDVPTAAPGTAHRNHCPHCLWSRHVDDAPGDRAAAELCGSAMEPIAVSVRGAGEWVLVHRCTGCGSVHLNRTAGDDSPLLLVRIAVGPLAQLPFPLDLLARI
jgi:RNHCP domain